LFNNSDYYHNQLTGITIPIPYLWIMLFANAITQ